MAAYAVSRRGGRRQMLLIGGVVALTHTAGVLVLGAVASTSSAFAPDRVLGWTGIVSALIVLAVGVNLLRLRWRGHGLLPAAGHGHGHEGHGDGHHEHDHGHEGHHHRGHDHGHDHDHAHDHAHDHGHDHGHDHHDHDHAHGHRHDHPHRRRRRERLAADPRLVVTSHRHGGVSHTHVLPAPGATVPRRELVAMGIAGGLVPSPSALVVLLAALALGRVGLGLALVVAYGVGLAVTLVGTGLLLARAEHRIRGWLGSLGPHGSALMVRALPLASAVAVSGAGLLLLVRSVASF